MKKKIKVISLLLVIGLFLVSPIVFSHQEQEDLENNVDEVDIRTERIPDEIIDRANQYIIFWVGETYFNSYIIQTGDATTGKTATEYLVKYKLSVFSHNNITNLGVGVSKMYVKLDQEGNILKYHGPKKPFNFTISEEHAIEIAKAHGLRGGIITYKNIWENYTIKNHTKNQIKAELCFGKDQNIAYYVWEVWTDASLKEGDIKAIYLDVGTGKVLATKKIFHGEEKITKDFSSLTFKGSEEQAIKIPKITNQWCDAMNSCPEGLECFSFSGIGLRCAQSNPCSYFKCPKGTQCSVAESYPGQVMCFCVGPECPATGGDENTAEYDRLTQTVVHTVNKDQTTSQKKITLWRTTILNRGTEPGKPISGLPAEPRTMDENRGILETPVTSVEYCGRVFIKDSKLFMGTLTGENPVNILPEDAIIKSKDIAENPEIKKVELKVEAGKPIYSVIGVKHAKLLAILPVNLEIETDVSAETGDIISVNKPWWSFLVW